MATLPDGVYKITVVSSGFLIQATGSGNTIQTVSNPDPSDTSVQVRYQCLAAVIAMCTDLSRVILSVEAHKLGRSRFGYAAERQVRHTLRLRRKRRCIWQQRAQLRDIFQLACQHLQQQLQVRLLR